MGRHVRARAEHVEGLGDGRGDHRRPRTRGPGARFRRRFRVQQRHLRHARRDRARRRVRVRRDVDLLALGGGDGGGRRPRALRRPGDRLDRPAQGGDHRRPRQVQRHRARPGVRRRGGRRGQGHQDVPVPAGHRDGQQGRRRADRRAHGRRGRHPRRDAGRGGRRVGEGFRRRGGSATPEPTATATPTATPDSDAGADGHAQAGAQAADVAAAADEQRASCSRSAARRRSAGRSARPRASTGRAHEGNDIFADFGTPVVAVADGELANVGTLPISGNRLWVYADSGDQFFYAHMSAFSANAVNGRRVEKGEVLGYVGNTGDAEPTPPHVHFEIHPERRRRRRPQRLPDRLAEARRRELPGPTRPNGQEPWSRSVISSRSNERARSRQAIADRPPPRAAGDPPRPLEVRAARVHHRRLHRAAGRDRDARAARSRRWP